MSFSKASPCGWPAVCRAGKRRSTQTLQWFEQNYFHPLSIALDHLTLDRSALYRAILEQAVFQYPPPDLAEARRLIEKHDYWRRKEELEDAEAAIHSRGGSLVVIPVPG